MQISGRFVEGFISEAEEGSYSIGNKLLKYSYPWNALNQLDIKSKITLDSSTKYIITGHSLGGALATLFAVQLYFKMDANFWQVCRGIYK